jgi:hypothetical protein
VAERCGRGDPRYFVNKYGRFRTREAAQQYGAFFELFMGALRRFAVEKRDHNEGSEPECPLPERTDAIGRSADTVLFGNHTLPRKSSISPQHLSANAAWRG